MARALAYAIMRESARTLMQESARALMSKESTRKFTHNESACGRVLFSRCAHAKNMLKAFVRALQHLNLDFVYKDKIKYKI